MGHFFCAYDYKKQPPARSGCFIVEFFQFCLFLAPAQFIYSEATPIISPHNACVNKIFYKSLVKNTTGKAPDRDIGRTNRQ